MNSETPWPGLDLWAHADRMVLTSGLVVDRPAGSAHPTFSRFVYPIDYGYLEDTVGGDGEGIDVWIGTETLEQVTAVVCTIDPYRRNAELKLLWRCGPEDIRAVNDFYEPQPQAAIILARPRAPQ